MRKNAPLLALVLAALTACGRRSESAIEPVSDTVRVLAYNIHHGEGMDSLLDLGRIADLIVSVRPDLVAVQEVDSVVDRTSDVDQAAELGRLTGLEPHFGSFMPYQGGAYGMAVLSRFPALRAENIRLPDGDEPRTALAVTVQLPNSGLQLRFVGIHFYRTDEERLAQATSLEAELESEPMPTILAGDFNSRPGSKVMESLERGWAIVDKAEDSFTFPSYAPDHEIDFVLMRPGGTFRVLGQRVLDEPVASDHRPVLVDLLVRR
ncbi:MAG: endonuclease/exonuclease/phosphatase family protein [Gemmatimonadota bacterium]|nr:endonuclease/exonuclease/phosphatase family protein [Gemmatimonadota bacterium]